MPRLQTLRPGPARIEDATPAAGPGERFAVAVVRLFEPCGPQPPAAEARKRAPQAAPDIPYEVTALTFAVKPLFASSAAFLLAIAIRACCGPPRPCDGRLVVRRRRMVVDLLFAAFGRWQFGVFPFPHAARLFVAPRQPFDGSLRALRPSIYAEVAGAAGPSDRILHGSLR